MMSHRVIRRVLFAALAFTCGAPFTAAAAPKWITIRTGSMTVLGDTSARTLREVAEELEEFRGVLGRIGASGRPAATAPTLVYVFGTRKTFEQFVPLRNGKPIQVGGYFQRGVDTNTIALSPDGFEESAPVIYHEYTHLLLGNSMRAMPLWLNEGLAEYYSTYHLRGGGKGADIGLAIAPHVALLRERFVPLAELLAVDHNSALYNETDRRSIFYAESWALTHFLMTELPSGPDQINQFAAAIAGGARPDEAFGRAFGTTPAAFEQQLRLYVRKLVFRAWIYTFKERLESERAVPAREISTPEADAWLGDLLLKIQRTSEAKTRIEGAAAAEPGNAVVQLALARLRISQGRDGEEPRAALARAAASAPDNFDVQYGAGVTSLQLTTESVEPMDRDLTRAHEALTRATVLDPQSPDAFGWLAYAGLARRDWDGAALAIARALMLAPGRMEFRLRQADIMILRGAPSAARPMLQEIASRSIDPVAVEGARRRLAALDAAGVSGGAATSLPPLPNAPSSAGPRIRLQLRTLADGETRTFGRLIAVDCTSGSSGQIRFRVDTNGQQMVTAAPNFGAVDLITYVEMKGGTLSCGPRPEPDPVSVTWRAEKPSGWPAEIAGVVVAIEFLPKDYVW